MRTCSRGLSLTTKTKNIRDYYEELRRVILQDTEEKLKAPMADRSADKIKKELDIARDCETIIQNLSESDDVKWADLSIEAQAKIEQIIQEDLGEETI